MTNIDAREAALALSDIASIAHRVRQSTTYKIASQMLIFWGVLIFAGNIATYLWPRQGGYIWIVVNVVGFAGSLAIGTMALVEAAVAVPISKSTLLSSTSLRALRVAADGSEPSSSWISLIFSAPRLLAYSTAAFMPRS